MTGQLNIRCFMHAPFEGPGVIELWIKEKNHHLDYTRFYEGDSLPKLTEVDILVGRMKLNG